LRWKCWSFVTVLFLYPRQSSFDYGVDAVSGAGVDDPDQALASIREGASFRQVRGLRRITIFKPENPR